MVKWLCKYSWLEDSDSINLKHTAHCVFAFDCDSVDQVLVYAQNEILPKLATLEKRSRYGGNLHNFSIEKVVSEFFEF